jgi:hypothetical protein
MKATKRRRKPVNITLSTQARRQAAALCAKLNRPSTSNLVETLIVEEHNRRFSGDSAPRPKN